MGREVERPWMILQKFQDLFHLQPVLEKGLVWVSCVRAFLPLWRSIQHVDHVYTVRGGKYINFPTSPNIFSLECLQMLISIDQHLCHFSKSWVSATDSPGTGSAKISTCVHECFLLFCIYSLHLKWPLLPTSKKPNTRCFSRVQRQKRINH